MLNLANKENYSTDLINLYIHQLTRKSTSMRTYIPMLIIFIEGLFSCSSEPMELTQKFTIDNTMTENDLSALIKEASLAKISIGIEAVGYNKLGKIKNIQGYFDCGTAGSGSFSSDKLGEIIITKKIGLVNKGVSISVKS